MVLLNTYVHVAPLYIVGSNVTMETVVMYYMNRIIKVGCLMYVYAAIVVLVSRHGDI